MAYPRTPPSFLVLVLSGLWLMATSYAVLYSDSSLPLALQRLFLLPVLVYVVFFVVRQFGQGALPMREQAGLVSALALSGSFGFMELMMHTDSAVSNRSFASNPLGFTLFSLGVLSAGLPLAIYFMQSKGFGTYPLVMVSVATLYWGFLVLLLSTSGWLGIISPPLSLIVGAFSTRNRIVYSLFLGFSIGFFVMVYISFWGNNLLGLWGF
jgi:hypothetical protein